MARGTDDLIDTLVDDLRPIGAGSVARTLSVGIGGGVIVAFGLMMAMLGMRPDLSAAAATSAYWIKFFYTLVLGIVAFAAVERLARPSGEAARALWAAAILLAAVAALAALQLSGAPPEARMPLVMGTSAQKCPWLIVVLSLPVLAGATAAMRRLAPTRPTLGGFWVGICAGAFGGFVYALHCDEAGIPFLSLWYTAGMLAVGALGALFGRTLLRWR
jgi:hypothetical protein